MKSALALCLVALAITSIAAKDFLSMTQVEEDLFNQFMKTYNKKYDTEVEMSNKFAVFKDNLKLIAKLQEENPQNQYGITKFSDITTEEFKATYLGVKVPTTETTQEPLFTFDENTFEGEAPSAWDWRQNGAVTNIKNQGQCGSCWAFSATANMEGQYFLSKSGALTSFSEQQIVDCDKLCQGCNGGWMIDAFIYVESAPGLETLAQYPYAGVDQDCKFKSKDAVAFVSGYFNVSTNETAMLEACYTTGPLSVAVDASSWQFYFGGVYEPLYCGHTLSALDHGVTVVGYGVDKSLFGEKPYWIIKNSWGTDWGLAGYMMLARNKGECGVNLAVSSSVMNNTASSFM